MTIPHTPTRLTVRANGDANSYALLDDKGRWFMSMLVNGEQMEAKQEANLRRLAACWNACADIPAEALEGSSVTALARDGGPVRACDLRRTNACLAVCEGFDTEVLESILLVGETVLTRFQARDRVEQTVIADRLKAMQERDALRAMAIQLRSALRDYEGARDGMFAQCCSNPVFDTWGRQVDMTLLNDAHQAAERALKAAEQI